MRDVLGVALMFLLGPSEAEPQSLMELLTARGAVLCVSPDTLDIANHPSVMKNLRVLQAMGCIRTEGGIKTTVLDGGPLDRPWRVRFYPRGISGGVELWTMASSLATKGGTLVTVTGTEI